MSSRQRKKKIRVSRCICPGCGNIFPIPRMRDEREKGHKKDLFCPWCKKIVTMDEIRDFESYRNLNGELVATAFDWGSRGNNIDSPDAETALESHLEGKMESNIKENE